MAGPPEKLRFRCSGIGSVPSLDPAASCREILGLSRMIPYWPQLTQLSPLEDMSVQFSEGLPLLELRDRRLTLSNGRPREEELVRFYDRFLAEDLNHFAISPDHARGFHLLLRLLEAQPAPAAAWVKGQTVGPVTFAAGILDRDGNSAWLDPELREAFAAGLAIKARWQVRELARSGRRPILFVDEPVLAGLGSAFSPLRTEDVSESLRSFVQHLREGCDALIGIHCCGNTDWSLIFEIGTDIVSFDASGFLEHFLLYPAHLRRFLEGGGLLAWGVVPTLHYTGKETVEELRARIEGGIKRIAGWGVDPALLAERSLLTPACGMATMAAGDASRALELLNRLSERLTLDA